MFKSRLLLPLLLAGPLVLPQTADAAQDVCVRQAQGVPGPSVKHPQWWMSGLSNNQHEVRWTGATKRTEGDGATPELVSSRVIWDKPSKKVFFEFNVFSDPSLDGTEDLVMFAVSDSAGTNPETFVLFQPLRGCGSATDCTGQGAAIPNTAISYSQATPSGTSISWSDLSPTNTSSSFTVEHPWVQVRETLSEGSTVYNWTLRFALEVPTAGGGQIRPNLRTYANAVMYMPGPTSGTAVEFPILCDSSSPTSDDCLVFSGGSGEDLTDGLPIANMDTSWPVLSSTDTSCSGIEIMRPLVGSDHGLTPGVVPGTEVPYELPGLTIPRDSGARFRAGFHNNTTETIPDGTITARFRIANWGLQWSQWDQATWDEVGVATLAGDVTAGSYAGGFGQGILESNTWVPADAELELENNHQCLHVQLDSKTAGVNFTRDSVFRNMDIVNASVARRPADIDLGSRPLPKGQKKHQVYLMVRSQNMPDAATCKKRKKTYGCSKGGKMVMERKALTSKQKKALQRDHKAGRIKMSKGELDQLLKQKKRKGKKPGELPFYAVYGMADTGRKINLPGAPQTPVLLNFSSYGYIVQHEGLPSEGFENYIHGAKPAGKNLYKMEIKPKTVASVANTVRVLSKETKPCKKKPKSTWAVYGLKKTEALEAKIKADVGKGKGSKVSAVRVTDGQLGCDPPPLRLPCRAKDCREHSPIDYIEGSRYVGDWKAVDRRGAGKGKRPALRPGARRPGARVPAGKRPTGKKPAGKRPTGKRPTTRPSTGRVPSVGRVPTAGKAPRGKKK